MKAYMFWGHSAFYMYRLKSFLQKVCGRTDGRRSRTERLRCSDVIGKYEIVWSWSPKFFVCNTARDITCIIIVLIRFSSYILWSLFPFIASWYLDWWYIDWKPWDLGKSIGWLILWPMGLSEVLYKIVGLYDWFGLWVGGNAAVCEEYSALVISNCFGQN